MSEKPGNAAAVNQPGLKRTTLTDVAKALGVSHTTVSLALRNHPRISESMRDKVKRQAEAMGYQPDPMLSALCHYRSATNSKPLQAELAWINAWSKPDELRRYHLFNQYREGAAEGAQRLGYQLQEFRTQETPLPRLQAILKARNIEGILLPPIQTSVDDWHSFPWSEFAVVRFGKTIIYPPTYMVSANQVANTIIAYQKILDLGYKRVGFMGGAIEMNYFAAGFLCIQRLLPRMQQLPILTLPLDEAPHKKKAALSRWLQKTKPDAIYTDSHYIPTMLAELGYRVPEDFGLATANLHDTPIDAGIDQNPKEIGRAAIRALTSLINEHQYGIPGIGNEILVRGHWVDGSMLPGRI